MPSMVISVRKHRAGDYMITAVRCSEGSVYVHEEGMPRECKKCLGYSIMELPKEGAMRRHPDRGEVHI